MSEQIPVIRIALTYPLGGKGAQISFETYAPQDVAKKDLDGIVDKLEAVSMRQCLKVEVARCEEALEGVTEQYDHILKDYQRVTERYEQKSLAYAESGRVRPLPLSDKEKTEKENILVSLETLKDKKERLTERIDVMKKVIADEHDERTDC